MLVSVIGPETVDVVELLDTVEEVIGAVVDVVELLDSVEEVIGAVVDVVELLDTVVVVPVVVVVVELITGLNSSIMIAPPSPTILLVMSLLFSSVTLRVPSAKSTEYVPAGVFAGTINVRTTTSESLAATTFFESLDSK